MTKLAVYCGASVGKSPEFEKATIKLGKWMVAHNFELVYGGGKYGLMGTLAKTIIDNKGKAYGIVPEALYKRDVTFGRLTELNVVNDMSERKKEMLKISDASLALPGGPGTLEEISQAFSWTRVGENFDPCVLYNVGGFYSPLEKMYDSMVENGFLTSNDRQNLLFSDSLPEILNFMKNHTTPQVRNYNEKEAAN